MNSTDSLLPKRRKLQELLGARTTAWMADGLMYAMMNSLQWHLRSLACGADEMERYLLECEPLTRTDYFLAAEPTGVREEADGTLVWNSPFASGFAQNDQFRVELFPVHGKPTAPTVILLHALMSADATGYRRVAKWFNDRGWAAALPHLPFHYSRVPRGFFNGSLAITANLIRNGETLRQGVVEIRQLMRILRSRGVERFGLVGTSYGGWVGSLVSFHEPDLEFLALLQPICDVEHAIWENPAAVTIRKILHTQGIEPGGSLRHAHLSSPMHGVPALKADRIILCSGRYDRVSPPDRLRLLAEKWGGAKYLEVIQGHFGYAALPATLGEVERML
jgi:dienelactone hydrolase